MAAETRKVCSLYDVTSRASIRPRPRSDKPAPPPRKRPHLLSARELSASSLPSPARDHILHSLVSFLTTELHIHRAGQLNKAIMGLPQLHSCCCGLLDLRTSNIVLGCLSAVFSLVLVAVMGVEAAETGALVAPEGDSDVAVERRAVLAGLYAMCVLLCVMFAAKLCFDLLFIFAVITERAGIIRAYFIMWIVFVLLSMFTFFINVSFFTVGTICTEVFYIGLNVYAVLLSHSLYRQINERREEL